MSSSQAPVKGFVSPDRDSMRQSEYGLARLIESNPAGGVPSFGVSGAPDVRNHAKREAAIAEGYFRQRNYRQTMVHLAEAIRLWPGEFSFHLNLGCAHWMAGELERVSPHFRAALALEPRNPSLHNTLALWFVQRGRLDEALQHSAAAVALAPQEVSFKITHADALQTNGQIAEAWEVLRPLALAGIGGPWLARVLARIAPRCGQEPQALETINRELRRPTLPPVDRARLHFVAATLLDGIGQYDLAFTHARLANAADRRPHDTRMVAQTASQRISFFTRQHLKSLPRATRSSKRSLLIVGMPRSGTTLVEQILASHSKVYAGGELAYLFDAAYNDDGEGWPDVANFPYCWDQLSVSRANFLASRYLDRIEALNSSATYVTNKMPTNFDLLGEAQLLLPDCKVIHCVRDPRDTCLSCYFTDFAIGNNFSFDLSHLASHYRDYSRLMNHWKSALDLPILDVRYEDLIADQAGQTRRMLEFLGLEWDQECLNFHQSKRHAATASRDQVCKPIYSSSVGRWKHYEKHLPELIALV